MSSVASWLIPALALGTTALMALLALYAWSQRAEVTSAPAFSGFCASVAVYAFSYGMEVGSSSLDEALFWTDLEYLGIAFLPAWSLIFILRFTANDAVLGWRSFWAGVWGIALATLLFKLTNAEHELFYREVEAVRAEGLLFLEITGGPAYRALIVYQNAVYFACALLIGHFVLQSSVHVRSQGLLMLAGLFVGWFGHVLYQYSSAALPVDFAPLSLSASALIWAFGVFRFGLLRLEPVANARVMTSMRDAVVVLDGRSQRVLIDNPAARELFARPDAAPAGAPVADYFEAFPAILDFLADDHSEAELAQKEKDGESPVVLARKTPLYSRSKRLPGQVLTCSDISARVRAERLRAQSETSYRDVIDSVADAILVQDRTGRFIDLNLGAVEMYGHDSATLIGRRPEFIADPDQEVEPRWMALLDLAIAGTPQRFDSRGLRASGESFPQEVRLYPGRYFDEGVTIAVVRDISQQREMEARLLQGQKMEGLGRLAGGVAHDFNNMLQVIIGHTDLARSRSRHDPELEDHLGLVKQAAESSAALTRQLLGFARKQVIEPRQLELNETVESSARLLDRLVDESIELHFVPAAQPLWLRIDRTQLDQILTNLIVNARDAMVDGGRITIETDALEVATGSTGRSSPPAPGAYVVLTVRDDGSGMTPEVLAHLFEPFYTTKPQGEGVGMGLATVYGIVEQNEGTIEVESEAGQGTLVRVCLPRVESEPELASGPEGGELMPPMAEHSILLVEDEPAILAFARSVLERDGYAVLAATTPQEALDLAASDCDGVDLLITDVVMPGMNGRQLAETLVERHGDLRVLYISGYTADAMGRRGDLGADAGFLQKPFSGPELVDRARQMLWPAA